MGTGRGLVGPRKGLGNSGALVTRATGSCTSIWRPSSILIDWSQMRIPVWLRGLSQAFKRQGFGDLNASFVLAEVVATAEMKAYFWPTTPIYGDPQLSPTSMLAWEPL